MRARVDEALCIACGLCVSISPEVYSFNDDGLAQAIDEEIDESKEAGAQEGADQCPTAAIKID